MISVDALVSVIIPVYNIEAYLDKAVQSVVSQTYDHLEIILVDDGSKDQSGLLCDRWKEKDSRIIVIHKPNGGLSSARNAALDICKGEYIYFLDGDDYISDDAIEVLLNDAVQTGADIVEAAYYDVYNDQCYSSNAGEEKVKILSPSEAIKYILGDQSGSISAWSKLYAKKIFLEIRFMEGKIQEDLFALADIISKANSVAIEPKPVYYYVHRKNSITTEPFTDRSMDTLEACRYNYEKVKELFPDAIDLAEFRLDYYTLLMIDRIMLLGEWKTNKYLPGLLAEVRQNKWRVLKSKYFVPQRKAAFLVLLISTSAYHEIIKAQAKQRGLA